MIIWVVRAFFIVGIISVLLSGTADGGPFGEFFPFMVGALMLVVALWVDFWLPRKKLDEFSGLFFGVVVGFLISLAVYNVVEVLYKVYVSESITVQWSGGVKSLITMLCVYISVVFVMQTKDDFRFIIPYVEFSKQTKGSSPLVMDTSVIIDGRIADIAKTGFLNAPLVIPRFVLDELQLIADSADRLKRNRGRRGLDILNKMQGDREIDLSIKDVPLSSSEAAEPVDLKLVTAAVKLNGRLITNDYNLNKVASLRGVTVLNINDLANAIKQIFLPGETLSTKIVKPGDQPGQGVGYLSDGTMIVVDQAKRLVGKDISVTVTSVLQTSAGRMIFGKLDDQVDAGDSSSA